MQYIVNVETNEIITREMTNAEIDQWELDKAAELQRIADEQAALDAKAAIATRLGLTADELATLLG